MIKVRIKATGEVINVVPTLEDGYDYIDKSNNYWTLNEVELVEQPIRPTIKCNNGDPDYWTRLEHQYAGMAMQGMLNNSLLITGLLKVNKSHEDIVAEVTGTAIRYAHALVEKMKEANR